MTVQDSSNSPPKSFFKVLLPGSFENMMSLPPRFVACLVDPQALQRTTAYTAKLHDPLGRSWDVELVRDGVRTLFAGREWCRFVTGNGLAIGQFLFFQYEGNLKFSVNLFDASGCLTEYNIDEATNDRTNTQNDHKNTSKKANKTLNGDCYGLDKSDIGPGGNQSIDSSRSNFILTSKSITTHRPQQMTGGECHRKRCARGTSIFYEEVSSEKESSKEEYNLDNSARRKIGKRESKNLAPSEEATPSTATTVWMAVDALPGSEPTIFRPIEKPYQLRYINLTKKFCQYIGWTTNRDIELCIAGENRTWLVSLHVSVHYYALCKHWRDFIRDNGIKLADSCRFKLVGSNKLEVQVIRA